MKLSTNSFFAALFLALLFNSCNRGGEPIELNKKKIILFAEFMHEVNSFNPVITAERDFRADHLFFGDDVVASAIEEGKQLAGFLSAVDKLGGGMVETVPLLHAKSMSGCPAAGRADTFGGHCTGPEEKAGPGIGYDYIL